MKRLIAVGALVAAMAAAASCRELAEGFENPAGKVKTGVYWYWMAGHVSCEGVVRDLEAMKRAGIDMAFIGDIARGNNAPGPVKTFSPEWEAALKTAFDAAVDLGIEIGLFNSPGWSQSGGPWVGKDEAMRRFVSSSSVCKGGGKIVLPPPEFEGAPKDSFRDVAVVAYPLPEGWEATLNAEVPGAVMEIVSPEPFTARSLEVCFGKGRIAGTVSVEAAPGGGWRKICEQEFSRLRSDAGTGFAPGAPVIAAFPAATARRWRVTVVPADGKCTAQVSSCRLLAAAMVASAFEKSLAKMSESPTVSADAYIWTESGGEAVDGVAALDASKAIALHGILQKNGALEVSVPSGDWIVFRFAAAPTGAKNGPANRKATGYEIDKMDAGCVAAHFDAYIGKILSLASPEGRKAIPYAVVDSYEAGAQNFCDGFAARFKASLGYDPVPWLGALTGVAVSSREESDRFLWDLRRFVADEIARAYVGTLHEKSRDANLKTWLENYGHWGFPAEALQYGSRSDEVAGEFWLDQPLGDIECRAASSCAHTYGKALCWAESNTSGGPPFSRSPADMKCATDRAFANGVNASILHVYIHQAYERLPGMNAWFGSEFNRNNAWFDHLDLFIAYLKRSGFMLRQGLNVADIACFIGEDAPRMTGWTDPAAAKGRQYDFMNAEVLARATVDDAGRLTLPHGTKYEILVLPPRRIMRPQALRIIERLVHAGAFVIGPKPERSPSLAGYPQCDAEVREIANALWGEVDGENIRWRKAGKGVIAWNLPLEEALAMRALPPDVEGDLADIAFCHRTMPEAEVYFLANQTVSNVCARLAFRVAGFKPELWNPATGERRSCASWREEGGRTLLELSLAPCESAFAVFPSGSAGGTRSCASLAAAEESVRLDGPWRLEFLSDEVHRGPSAPLEVKTLADLSRSADSAVKFYSGKILYKTRFTARKPAAGEAAHLALGEVREMCKVRINGRDAGGVWTPPYELPVGDVLSDGENTLEVEVSTCWANRIVGDSRIPKESRPTWHSANGLKPRHPLKKTGLLGPVEIRYSRCGEEL